MKSDLFLTLAELNGFLSLSIYLLKVMHLQNHSFAHISFVSHAEDEECTGTNSSWKVQYVVQVVV